MDEKKLFELLGKVEEHLGKIAGALTALARYAEKDHQAPATPLHPQGPEHAPETPGGRRTR